MKNLKILKMIWYLSWIGTFSWVLILSVILLINLKFLHSLIGFALFSSLIAYISLKNPWKNPNSKLFKLMLIPYLLLILSVLWILNAYNAFSHFKLYYYIILINTFIPVITIGNKKGSDFLK